MRKNNILDNPRQKWICSTMWVNVHATWMTIFKPITIWLDWSRLGWIDRDLVGLIGTWLVWSKLGWIGWNLVGTWLGLGWWIVITPKMMTNVLYKVHFYSKSVLNCFVTMLQLTINDDQRLTTRQPSYRSIWGTLFLKPINSSCWPVNSTSIE